MEIKLCGVGGQGLGLAGRLLGEAAIAAGFHAAQTTAYGVESRGGLSTSDVLISEDDILFPEVRHPDVLLLMANKGLNSNLKGVQHQTLILFDPAVVSDPIDSPGNKKTYPFLDLALKEFNNNSAATIIGLGALVHLTKVVPFELIEEAIRQRIPAKAHQLNVDALNLGRKIAGG
ncbi:2-oxoacid:acceptor oxidoreductase family protein [bacterium]|nr:2-oxoacid:acceptor oxidoreductase family protein [bacterium]MBU1652734.1 2-oxoacid:acceptor oxidoreductase family protein [bacterium]MBU1881839.1 2-oxoacid:acceptor oxidoreductase family protein [bacterium]